MTTSEPTTTTTARVRVGWVLTGLTGLFLLVDDVTHLLKGSSTRRRHRGSTRTPCR